MTYRYSSFYCCVIGTDEAPSRKLTLRQPLTDGGGQPVFSVAVLPHHTLANIPHIIITIVIDELARGFYVVQPEASSRLRVRHEA